MRKLAIFVAGALAVGGTARAQPGEPRLRDPVARLGQRIERGEVVLDYQPGPLGYLPSLLKNLDIRPDSQVLVFSKTSFQAAKISPKAPRAIYFNDSVAVGSVQTGEVFELISMDPRDGLIFYSLGVQKADKPRFERRGNVCFMCHAPPNQGVPGLMVTSVIPDSDGTPFFLGTAAFAATTDHRTPFEDRWGGWYVTGSHGSQRHMGNAVAPNPDRPGDLESQGTQNLTSLAGKFDPSGYLSGSSDIVALMTLEHQTGALNLIARLGWLVREAAPSPEVTRRTGELVKELVRYLFFSGEAPLAAPIQGTSGFAKSFAGRGPRDSQGRSLRDFDLHRRLFRYPLSYTVYQEAFEGLPAQIRERVYRALYEVLTGRDTSPEFGHLSPEDRRAILEILRETKPNLPAYWRPPGG